MTLRLDLPIRTSDRKAEGRSPQQQRDMAQACADRNGYEIVAVHDSGRSESGRTMDRESLRRVIERVQRGETDGMILPLADRLGRAPIEEAMTYVRGLTGAGKLVLADMGGVPIDLNDPAQESNLVFQLQMARQYWLATQQRSIRTRREAVAEGKFVGPTPLGYRREKGRLLKGEAWPVLERAYELAGTRGIHAAVDHLAAEFPGKRWDPDRVRRLLASRVYLGESRSGEFVNREAHDGVDPDVWTAAQSEPQARRANGDYPLSGLMFCGRCDWDMTGALQTVPSGHSYRRYRCSNPACRGGSSISAEKVETYVREAMREAAPMFRRRYGVDGVEQARRAVQRARAERKALTSKVRPSHPAFDSFLAQADADVQRAERAYRELSQQAAQREDLPGAEALDDPAKLSRIVRFAVERAGWRPTVAPGRGAVAVRVDLGRLDDGTGVLAA